MISENWIRWWLGAVRQQAITWTNIKQDLCPHMVLLGHNELNANVQFGDISWSKQFQEKWTAMEKDKIGFW